VGCLLGPLGLLGLLGLFGLLGLLGLLSLFGRGRAWPSSWPGMFAQRREDVA
jgi:hypothetical protein